MAASLNNRPVGEFRLWWRAPAPYVVPLGHLGGQCRGRVTVLCGVVPLWRVCPSSLLSARGMLAPRSGSCKWQPGDSARGRMGSGKAVPGRSGAHAPVLHSTCCAMNEWRKRGGGWIAEAGARLGNWNQRGSSRWVRTALGCVAGCATVSCPSSPAHACIHVCVRAPVSHSVEEVESPARTPHRPARQLLAPSRRRRGRVGAAPVWRARCSACLSLHWVRRWCTSTCTHPQRVPRGTPCPPV